MRFYELLMEKDNRDRKQKLIDLIKHPNTEATIKRNALEKLKSIVDEESSEMEMLTSISDNKKLTSPIKTNISSEDLEKIFSTRTTETCYQILCNLKTLSPPPIEVLFYRNRSFELILGPPFTTSAAEYIQELKNIVPGIRSTKITHLAYSRYSILCTL